MSVAFSALESHVYSKSQSRDDSHVTRPLMDTYDPDINLPVRPWTGPIYVLRGKGGLDETKSQGKCAEFNVYSKLHSYPAMSQAITAE